MTFEHPSWDTLLHIQGVPRNVSHIMRFHIRLRDGAVTDVRHLLMTENILIFQCITIDLRQFQAEYFGEYMPMVVFGVAALLAAALTMTLPESKNIKLPDTIDEAERIGNEDKLQEV